MDRLEERFVQLLQDRAGSIDGQHFLVPVEKLEIGIKRATRRSRYVSAGIAAGLVASVFVGSQMVARLDKQRESGVSSIAVTDYARGRWALIRVIDSDQETAVPRDLGAYMEFPTPTAVMLFNGVNTLTGRHVPLGDDSFQVDAVGTTFAGYIGSDATRLTVIRAMNAVAYGNAVGDSDSGHSANSILALDASRMTVRAADFELTFERMASDEPETSGTPTGTAR